MTLNEEQEALLKKLVPELELWPGAAETPNGLPLSEKDDEVLWGLIDALRAATS